MSFVYKIVKNLLRTSEWWQSASLGSYAGRNRDRERERERKKGGGDRSTRGTSWTPSYGVSAHSHLLHTLDCTNADLFVNRALVHKSFIETFAVIR